MADDLALRGLLGPLRFGIHLVRAWAEGPDRSSVYNDHVHEWVAETAQKLREVERDVQTLAERLDALEQDRERVLVLGNYGNEAMREAVDRRRAMLGDAAVAAVFSELSAAELARVERTIRMLDPEDLDLLARFLETGQSDIDIALAGMAPQVPDMAADLRWQVLRTGHLGGANLAASGCVNAWDFGRRSLDRILPLGAAEQDLLRRGAEITPLGQLVLRFMGST